jgi:hypothetical protein
MKEIFRRQNSRPSRQASPDSLLGISPGIYQIALVNEIGMIRTQMWTQSRSEKGRFVRHHPATVTLLLAMDSSELRKEYAKSTQAAQVLRFY